MSLPHVTHLIVELRTGGAEWSLLRLLEHTRDQYHHRVICLGPPPEHNTDIGARIAALGVDITWYNYRASGPWAVFQAWRALRRQPPDILQSWMYPANALAGLLQHALPARTRVCWNVRQSPVDLHAERRRVRFWVQAPQLAWLRPDAVIYNSHAGQTTHAPWGYATIPAAVITNGINTQLFQPNPEARARVRTADNPQDKTWVSMVCRYHPRKGVANYLRMVKKLRASHPQVMFSLIGEGMHADNAELMGLLGEVGLSEVDVALLGPRSDIHDLLPALDLLVLASQREGTPNILLEALACEVPCVATNVGDVAQILGEPGKNWVVAPDDADALAAATEEVLTNLQNTQGEVRSQAQLARQRMVSQYGIEQCMSAYHEFYQQQLRT